MAKSGAQNFFDKLKALFVSKSENVYGDDNTDNTDSTYEPGLVPTCGKNTGTSPLFLGSDGKWKQSFEVDTGLFSHGSSGNQTISSNLKNKRYIEVFDSDGALVMAAKIGAADAYHISSTYSRIGAIISADANSVTMTFGNSSGDGTYYWKLIGTP